jgi:MFS family permease
MIAFYHKSCSFHEGRFALVKRAFALNGRLRSILAFSFLSGYILSFAFEGQILYSLLELHGVAASGYIMLAVTAQFFGLFTCGLYTKSAQQAKTVMFFGLGTSLISSVPFFFPPSVLWGVGLAVGGYASGASLAAWGYFLKAFTPKQERLRTCADVLIGSNVIMVALNVLSTKLSPQLGLAVVIFGLLLGMASVWTLNLQPVKQKGDASRARAKDSLRNGVLLLCLFVAVLTINSGLMYHVIQPAFEHLGELTVWYWPVPYIAALVVLRNLPSKIKHSRMLYAGMAGTVLAFLGFMFLGRDTLSYLIVDTLFLATESLGASTDKSPIIDPLPIRISSASSSNLYCRSPLISCPLKFRLMGRLIIRASVRATSSMKTRSVMVGSATASIRSSKPPTAAVPSAVSRLIMML